MKNFRNILAASLVLASAAAAQAATVSFVGTADGTDFSITFDDSVANLINVAVTSSANPNEADLIGLAFDWEGDPRPEADDFAWVSSNNGEIITAICIDAISCGTAGTNGVNGLTFSGTGISEFDYIIRMGAAGTQDYLTCFAFSIASGLGVEAISGFLGIRAQSTGLAGEGSIKLVEFERVPEVPQPAAGWLLLGGLGGLAVLRRRKKA